ncbi:hypothetical protein PBRA_002564 [Plasmodiophora brassicae]|uniref:MYND-type domain-containing protein n=1 Tax=Plasmodiophora brassicae TaxID=37360 RepID=A0A0G4J524_PLABS|nr:hypothetical protein PBRA_002564 [Plasmodiophora brassicae]
MGRPVRQASKTARPRVVRVSSRVYRRVQARFQAGAAFVRVQGVGVFARQGRHVMCLDSGRKMRPMPTDSKAVQASWSVRFVGRTKTMLTPAVFMIRLVLQGRPRRQHRMHRCAFCGRCAPSLAVCGRCRSARYCNQQCQVSHWVEHRLRCTPPSERDTTASRRVDK